MFKQLHWLPIKQRIIYKIAVSCYKCLKGSSPIYLQEFLEIYTPKRTLRSSSDKSIFKIPSKHYKFYGERSFDFAGPQVWNSLPKTIRESPSLNIFKSNLKTYLFLEAFGQ